MPEHISAEHLRKRWVCGFGSTGEVSVAARLRKRGPTDVGAFVRRVGNRGLEVGQDAPNRGKPIDPGEAANAGVEHDGVESGRGAQELRRKRVHRVQRG